jgi:hypothetical protein
VHLERSKNNFNINKCIVLFYRTIFESIKIALGLAFIGFLLVCINTEKAEASMYKLYKAKDYQALVDTYGAKYANLSYNELILLSESYKNLKNSDRQIKILKHLNLKKPNYYKIHLAIADASKEKVYKAILSGADYKSYQQSLTDAVEYYRSAITLNPKDITAYNHLMKIYKDQENVAEGLALTKSMIKQFGETPNIVLDLCEWTSKYGLVAQTQKACLSASKLAPQDPKPLIHMALSIKDSGEIEKYQSEIFKIYEKFPNDEEIIDLIGEIHIENKDFVNAEKVLLKNKNSKIETSRINLATALYENEKYDEALAYFASSCSYVNQERKKLIRYFESRLRRLEINGLENESFKFQRELNVCRATPVVITPENKIRSGHFSEGIRLPANAKNKIDGQTLSEKRQNYEESRMKGNAKKTDSDSKKNTGPLR